MTTLAALVLFALGWRDPYELHQAMAELGFDCTDPGVRDAIMARARIR